MRHPLYQRFISALLVPLHLFGGAPASLWAFTPGAETTPVYASAPVFAEPKKAAVVPNRTLPVFAPALAVPAFSELPSDEEICNSRVLEEILVPSGTSGLDHAENKALAEALVSYGRNRNSLLPLTQFLERFPSSKWRAAILLHLGIRYHWTGYFSKALSSWEASWRVLKGEDDISLHALADRSVAELIELNARLGRFEALEKLFAEIAGRTLMGSAAEKVSRAREGYASMMVEEDASFLCGPMAVAKVRAALGKAQVFHPNILEAKSTQRGTSLSQVRALAESTGLGLQMVRKPVGAKPLLPCVVHWKLDHFGALVKEEGGRYLLQDLTSSGDRFVTQDVLDSEGSGYYLVQSGELPSGWRPVDDIEGGGVWGKGNAGVGDSKYVRRRDRKVCGSSSGPPGMAYYSVHAMVASLSVSDTPVAYAPPVGPAIPFTVTYNERDPGIPAGPSYGNFGAKWSYEWLSFLDFSGAEPLLFVRGGGQETCPLNQLQRDSMTILTQTGKNAYQRLQADGSYEVFDLPGPSSTVLMTKVVDAVGNTVTLSYDSLLRLRAITDAIGQVTTIDYNLSADPTRITKVTDPFGRLAEFRYNSLRELQSITDVVGIKSEFGYQEGSMTSLVTPYGTNTFVSSEFTDKACTRDYPVREVIVTDPLGQKERVFYRGHRFQNRNCLPVMEETSLLPSGITNKEYGAFLHARNTFYYDKKAMSQGGGQGTETHIFHWLHGPVGTSVSSILESERTALTGRIFYEYGNADNRDSIISLALPKVVSRFLDDGSSQVLRFDYNGFGLTKEFTDPVGRKTALVFSTNNIDIKEVRQRTGTNDQLLAKATYNSKHQLLTSTDAGGQTTRYGYNSIGQIVGVTNARNEVVTFIYDPNGYLRKIVEPISQATIAFTHDDYGRVRTKTDSEGYTTTYDYDALDRVTQVTFPNGDFEFTVYDRMDAVASRDRNGHWTRVEYDALQRPKAVTDALGRVTKLDWCGCGSLDSITDARNNKTTWLRDLLGRVTQKIYPDGTSVRYEFGRDGRLNKVTDAKNQETHFSYFADDNTKSVSYANSVVPTPSVAYSYDTAFNRLTQMIDGSGTNTFSYYPITSAPGSGAGLLATIDGPLPNDTIEYQYDELNRITNRAIGGVSSTVLYDSLGRVHEARNPLGRFVYDYVEKSSRLKSIGLPNGQNTSFEYFNNFGDFRLKILQHRRGDGSLISRNDYTYDALGLVRTWAHGTDATPAQNFSFGYDAEKQLQSATLTASSGEVLKSFFYRYDAAGNRVGEQVDSWISTTSANNLNQLTGLSAGGQMRFRGKVDEPSRVTVGTTPATVMPDNSFTAEVSVHPGATVLPVSATDGNGNTQTSSFRISVTGPEGTVLGYDSNGNTAAVSNLTTLLRNEWDARDRLVAINQGTHRSEFFYDGFDRRVRIVEKEGRDVLSEKRFVWCGFQICEERDSLGVVTKRFFDQGVQGGGQLFYYTRDHLGSVRELTDSTGIVRARYSYEPFGSAKRMAGDIDSDFGFTGHYHHLPSGLNLTLFRAYDSRTGRWLSRDPLDETQGINRYAYVLNNPLRNIDILGLDYWDIVGDSWDLHWQPFLSGLWNVATGRQPTSEQSGAFQDFIAEVVLPLSMFPPVRGCVVGAGALRGLDAAKDTVTVTRWGRDGLQAGDWVMKGEKTFLNYIKSGKWDPFPWNEPARFSSGQSFEVLNSAVKLPQAEGILGKLKGWIYGQHQYLP